jgi:hypothetical protein
VVDDCRFFSLTLMKNHEWLDLLKAIGDTHIYDEYKKKSLKLMVNIGKLKNIKLKFFKF